MSETAWRTWIRSRVQALDLFLWVLEGNLACSPRPLRYHPRFGGRVPLLPCEATDALLTWLLAVRRKGIGTIICLATPGELKRYANVVGTNADLISLYRSEGFVVHHHPIEDPAHVSAEVRVGILEQLERLKPVVLSEYEERAGGLLIHCSGGMDRTAPIAAFIASRKGGDCPGGGTPP
jgi:Cyclin-dependent kinase inhibitor 3 (CDKN3)